MTLTLPRSTVTACRGLRLPARGTRVAAAATPLFLAACAAQENDYTRMDEVEKARRVAELRREAEEYQRRWYQSMVGDKTPWDLKAIEEFTRLHRETTEIYPSPVDCPMCFFWYGVGLRLQGIYYDVLYKAQERELDRPGGRDRAELEELVSRNRELARRFFRQSLQQFEAYLASSPVPDPRVYDWASQQAAELGDYNRAIRYLERYMQAWRHPEETMARLERRHGALQRAYERQLIEGVEEDLGR